MTHVKEWTLRNKRSSSPPSNIAYTVHNCSTSSRTIEAVQAAIRAAGHEVKSGGELFSDTMDEPGTPADTYIGMMRHNLDTIVEVLRCYPGASQDSGFSPLTPGLRCCTSHR